MKAFNLCEEDIVLCEICHKQAVDLHHIDYKSQLGKDDADNLIALCRKCHMDIHAGKIKKEYLEKIIKERT